MAPNLDYFSHELWLLKHSMALLFVRQLHRKPLPQLSYPFRVKWIRMILGWSKSAHLSKHLVILVFKLQDGIKWAIWIDYRSEVIRRTRSVQLASMTQSALGWFTTNNKILNYFHFLFFAILHANSHCYSEKASAKRPCCWSRSQQFLQRTRRDQKLAERTSFCGRLVPRDFQSLNQT